MKIHEKCDSISLSTSCILMKFNKDLLTVEIICNKFKLNIDTNIKFLLKLKARIISYNMFNCPESICNRDVPIIWFKYLLFVHLW